ncbi:MAG TPA: ABC transporter permease, partial [Acidobacteriota bacterium]|nr:ABC transporter permease [Acidobacteriota bacterium]
NFMVPAILGLILMIMTIALASMGIVREKEAGTMEQLIVTPIRSTQLIAGKLLPFIFIGLVEATFVIVVARFWFGIPIRGSLPLLYAMCLLFMINTLAMGLFISTISRSQQQAMFTTIFFVMPMILLGGFVFPIENMPRVFQWVSRAIPTRYFFVSVRGIMLRGAGIAELWPEAAALLVIGTVIFTLSVLRFHKKLD